MPKIPGEHEKVVAFGWLMFVIMILYMLATFMVRGCALGSGLTPNF